MIDNSECGIRGTPNTQANDAAQSRRRYFRLTGADSAISQEDQKDNPGDRGRYDLNDHKRGCSRFAAHRSLEISHALILVHNIRLKQVTFPDGADDVLSA